MKKYFKSIIVVVVLVFGITVAYSAIAAKPSGDTRPGWGFGDKNHVHTGPKGGPSVHPVK